MASFSIENKKIFVFLLPITLDDDDNNNFASKVTVQKDLQYYKLGVPCYAAVSLLIFIKNIIKI
jgi:hypothetical protein